MKQSHKHSSHLKFHRVVHRDGSVETVRAYDVLPHAFASVPYKVEPCIVHRSVNGSSKSWRVTDKGTGAWIAFDGSPDKAIYAAALKLATKQEWQYRAAMDAVQAKREAHYYNRPRSLAA